MKIVISTGDTVGLAVRIIDDSRLVLLDVAENDFGVWEVGLHLRWNTRVYWARAS